MEKPPTPPHCCSLLQHVSQAVTNALDEDRMTPLHHACKAGSKGTVAVLLQRVDPEALKTTGGVRRSEEDGIPDEPLGMTAVHWAFAGGASEVVHLILSHQVARWGYSGGYIEPAGAKYQGMMAANRSSTIEKDSLSLSLTSISEMSAEKSPTLATDQPPVTVPPLPLRTASLPVVYATVNEHVLSLQEMKELRQQLKEEVANAVARRRLHKALNERVKGAERSLHESERERRLLAAELERKRDEFVQAEWNAHEAERLEEVVEGLSSRVEGYVTAQQDAAAELHRVQNLLEEERKSTKRLESREARLEVELVEAKRRVVGLEDKVSELRGLLKAEIEQVGEAHRDCSVWRMKHRKLTREVNLSYPLAADAELKGSVHIRPKSAKLRSTKKLGSPNNTTKRVAVPSHWLSKSMANTLHYVRPTIGSGTAGVGGKTVGRSAS